MSALGDQDKKIKVAVRARPLHPVRERYDSKCVRKVGESDIVVTGSKDGRTDTSTFSFDYAFDEDDQQIEVYNEAVLDLVDSTLDGHNACVLAYGQTGSGKTFTMLGEVDESGASLLKPNSGLFLRVLTDLFLYKERCKGHMHVAITLSIIEIYIQEVRDLLQSRKTLKVQTIRDDVALVDLKIVSVNDLKDVFQYFKIADKQRVAKKTAMNDVSSRSHALFMIDLFQQAKTASSPEPPSFDFLKKMVNSSETQSTPKGCDVPVQKSRIVLVDLAGSERIGRSQVEGKMKDEAIAINMSLTVLGTVVTGLYKGTKHVPYRDSALTMTLKSVFTDPNCKVLLCANMSPANTSHSETKSTLTFANKVKEIKAASVSVDPQAEIEYLERLKTLEELCGDLRIAAVLHEFILQTPSRIRHVPLKDEAGRAKLLDEVITKYKEEVSRRKAIKEQRETDEIHSLAKSIADKEIHAMQAKQEEMHKEIEVLTAGIAKLEKDVVTVEEEKKGEIEAKTLEAKRVRKKRRDAEDRAAKLTQRNKELEAEISELQKQLALKGDEIEKQRSGDGHVADPQEEEEVRRSEEHFKQSSAVFDKLMHLRNHQIDYLRHRAAVVELRAQLNSHPETHRLDGSYTFVKEMVLWLADRAARVSEGRASLHDGESFDHLIRLLPLDAWPNPLALTHSHGAYPDPDVQDLPLETDCEEAEASDGEEAEDVTSVDAVYADRPEQPAAPVQYDFVSAQRKKEEEEKKILEEKAKQRQRMVIQQARKARSVTSDVTKRFDEEEADKKYLMEVYDQEELVRELLRYLYSGTVLTKHGRTGKPHKRKFCLPCVSHGQSELTWMETVQSPEKAKRGVQLADITGIVMGMYSKVFKRNKVGPTTPGFYTAFSLVIKEGKRTIDVVADSVAEFEAWLVGLSHLLKKEVVWGQPLQFSQLGDPNEEKLAAEMSPDQRERLSKHHIPPSLLLKLRKIVSDKRDEVLSYSKLFNGDMTLVYQAVGGIHPPALDDRGALLFTKGELRYYSEVDIFRTCVLWMMLRDEGLIFDPKFRLPAKC